jgi:hypothetical protein
MVGSIRPNIGADVKTVEKSIKDGDYVLFDVFVRFNRPFAMNF